MSDHVRRAASADARGPIARSPIAPAPPVAAVAGWEVSARRSDADLTVTDLTPLAKVQVKAPWDGALAGTLGGPFGRAERSASFEDAEGDDEDVLVVGSGPGEWLALGSPGTAPDLVERLERLAARLPNPEFVTVVDLTHGRALIRIAGERTPDLLAKVCGIDLGETVTPNGAAFRSSVARLAVDVVRYDRDGTRSYLLHCERSSGQYLFDALLDAGGEFGAEIDGFVEPGLS
ncbi:MAG: hypothetical protein GEV03_00775 [Streptosporangiales bacterium]|nr:hypothetical protein [Streptosporangiales bacterium]